ncbi:MAG: acyl carrier protein [Campylobacteraceae bacterium]|jgi:acyl carrier protein|nr:acyl carrier protein [Campylobacteraceae bacterium]
MSLNDIKHELKVLIIQESGRDISPDEIDDKESLFGSDSKLALDSLDALQISMALHHKYGKKLNDSKEAMRILLNIDTLAKFITKVD